MRRISFLASLALLLLAAVGSVTASAKSPSILYSVSAGSATVKGHTVTFPAAARASWFTDRPGRRAGQTTLGAVVALWSAAGFDRIPPNGALVTRRDGAAMTTIVTLTNPRVVGDDVRFRFRVLKSGRAMGMRTTGSPVAGTYGNTELFLDGASDPPCGYSLHTGQSCLFDVANGAYSYLAADPGYVLLCSVGSPAAGVDVMWYSITTSSGIADENLVTGVSPPLCATTSSYGAGSGYTRTKIRLMRGTGPAGVVRVTSTS